MKEKNKCRIFQFAEEVGVKSKEIITALADSGVTGKTASSGITESQFKELKKKFSVAAKTREKKPAAKAKQKSKAHHAAPSKKAKPAPAAAAKEPEKKAVVPVAARKRKRSKYVKFVHVIARELGVGSTTLIEKIEALGIKGKKPSSGITEEEYNRIREEFLEKPKPKKEKKEEKKEAALAPPEAAPPAPPAPAKKKIKIDVTTTVGSLAEKLKMPAVALIKKLLKQRIIMTINQRLDLETASLIIQEEGFEPDIVDIYEDAVEKSDDRDMKRAVARPPVVTIMGHVDHGKTSLLDYIRKSHITQKEFGSITQHIGAYQIEHAGKKITFIDTPGHEAFTAMRLRGTQVTDIVVLVVAADDGVMPQTHEAISHAQLAGAPIIVAVNKMDLPHANPEKVKEQLARENLIPEDWGGKTVIVPVSAKTGEGVNELLDMIELQAEMMDLKADPECRARGVVMDAKLDPRRGPISTVILKEGRLKTGDPFVCGFAGGKIRAMVIEGGRTVRDATGGTPVEIMGFSGLPEVGDEFCVIADADLSRNILASRKKIKDGRRIRPAAAPSSGTSDEKTVNIILKADVMGSLEAIKDAFSKLTNPEVTLNILHDGCGGINKSDVLLAQASGSIIIGFNVRATEGVDAEAQAKDVEIRTYTVIYELIEDTKKALEGKLKPVYKEAPLGRAEVRRIYTVSKVGTIAGCAVKQGRLKSKSRVRLVRDSNIVYTGRLQSLKRFKDDVQEVLEGTECGLMLEKYNDIKPGDMIEAYELQKIERALNDGKNQ